MEGALAGDSAWLRNPYPLTDTTHYKQRLGDASGRPEWVPCRVLERKEGTATIETLDDPPTRLDKREGDVLHAARARSELARLARLNEPTVLHSVQSRYHAEQAWTWAGRKGGPLVQVLPRGLGVFGLHQIKARARERPRPSKAPRKGRRRASLAQPEDEDEPHLYDAARGAVLAALDLGAPQLVVALGEAGSGKTEACKLALEFACVAFTDADFGEGATSRTMGAPLGRLENPFYAAGAARAARPARRLLAACALVEPFTHCASGRNPNASRCCTVYRLSLRSTGARPRLAGGAVDVYALEAFRAARSPRDEPSVKGSFHALAWLADGARGASERARLRLPEGGRGPRLLADAVGSGRDWPEARRLWAAVVKDDAFDEAIAPVVAAVLALGDVEIGGGETAEYRQTAPAERRAADAAALLGIDAAALRSALLERQLPSTGAARPGDAAAARDGLIAALWGRLSRYVALRASAECRGEAGAEVLIVDGGGLDDAGRSLEGGPNYFDDLLHNASAERAQAFFLDQTFAREKHLYEAEGLKPPDDLPEPRDNEAARMLLGEAGLPLTVKEAATTLGETDGHVLQSIVATHKASPAFEPGRRQRAATSFTVKHAAGEVAYDADAILRRATLSGRAWACLAKSRSPLVRALFGGAEGLPLSDRAAAEAAARVDADGTTVGPFFASLYDLYKLLEAKAHDAAARGAPPARHVLCCRPAAQRTADKTPGLPPAWYEPAYAARQLLGPFQLPAAAALARVGLRWRATHGTFYARFAVAARAVSQAHARAFPLLPPPPDQAAAKARRLLDALLVDPGLSADAKDAARRGEARVGASLVLLSAPLAAALAERAEAARGPCDAAASGIQAFSRSARHRKAFRRAVVGLRALAARAKHAPLRRHLREKKAAARKIIGLGREKARNLTRRKRHAMATRVARWYRSARARQRCSSLVAAARAAPALARSFLTRREAARHRRRALATKAFLVAVAIPSYRRRAAAKRAATGLQAARRGHQIRREGGAGHKAHDAFERAQRAKRLRDTATRVAGHWARVLHTRRFRQLRTAADVARRWARCARERRWYLKAVRAAVRFAALGRGAAGRRDARRRLVAKMMVEERFQLRCAREREVLHVAERARAAANVDRVRAAHSHMSSSPIENEEGTAETMTDRCRSSQTKRAQCLEFQLRTRRPQREARAAARRFASRCDLVDADCRRDLSAAYPGGWARALDRLQRDLGRDGRHLCDVAVGEAHSAALDHLGALYTWGLGDRGQLGEAKRAEPRGPKRVEFAAAPAAGDIVKGALASRTAGGSTLTGNAFDALTRRHGRAREADPHLPPPPRGLQRVAFASLSSGADFCAALSVGGRVYAWGANGRGQLGGGTMSESPGGPPRCVETGGLKRRRATAVACGGAFCVAVAAPGVVVAWGAREALGIDPGGPPAGNVASKAWRRAADVATPTLVRGLDDDGASGRVRYAWKASCGLDFCVVVTRAGTRHDVFAWGSNDRGQLGLGPGAPARCWRPRPVEGRGASRAHLRRAADVACGARHALCLSATGVVLASGANGDGQLGLGDRADRRGFCVVRGSLSGVAVQQIRCGWRHSAALTSRHELFAWGAAACVAAAPMEVAARVASTPQFPAHFPPDPRRHATPEDLALDGREAAREREALEAAARKSGARRDWTGFSVDAPRLAPVAGRRWRVPTGLVCAASPALSATLVRFAVVGADAEALSYAKFVPTEMRRPPPAGAHGAPPGDARDAPLRSARAAPWATAVDVVAAALREEAGGDEGPPSPAWSSAADVAALREGLEERRGGDWTAGEREMRAVAGIGLSLSERERGWCASTRKSPRPAPAQEPRPPSPTERRLFPEPEAPASEISIDEEPPEEPLTDDDEPPPPPPPGTPDCKGLFAPEHLVLASTGRKLPPAPAEEPPRTKMMRRATYKVALDRQQRADRRARGEADPVADESVLRSPVTARVGGVEVGRRASRAALAASDPALAALLDSMTASLDVEASESEAEASVVSSLEETVEEAAPDVAEEEEEEDEFARLARDVASLQDALSAGAYAPDED